MKRSKTANNAFEDSGSVKTADRQSKRGTANPRASERASNDGSEPNLRLSSFSANPQNPRKISDQQLEALRLAMGEFGDLSGLVVNLTTGNMVGGHQRVKILGDAPITILHRYDKPTKQGTVADGWVNYNGEKFVYRAVRWNKVKEQAAMIAANKHGGEFDDELVKSLLAELSATGEIDMTLTGFAPDELEAMFGPTDEEIERGALLAVLNVSIAEPTIKVESGQIWRAGDHAICCLDVLTEWHVWIQELKGENDIFLPYAGPLVLLTENAKSQRLVIVQPDPYLCGLILDKFVEANLGTPHHD